MGRCDRAQPHGILRFDRFARYNQRRRDASSYHPWRRASSVQCRRHRRTNHLVTKGETAEAAPADFVGSHGSIRPFQGSPWDGRHFCAEDWHVILVAGIDGGDASFRREQAVASASQTTFDFTLDGAPLATNRTAIRRLLSPETIKVPQGVEKFKVAYFFQEGRIMSPEDLSVGQHELTLTQTDTASGQVEHDGITFFIDAAGTGACLND
jgi:hypothetical protein